MIFVILASFVVCWCPFHIEKLIEIADTAQDIDEAAFINGDITGVTQNDPCNDLTNSTVTLHQYYHIKNETVIHTTDCSLQSVLKHTCI